MHQMGSILYWWSDTLNVPVTIALMGVNGTTIICFLFCLVCATTEKWVELFQGVCLGNAASGLSRAAVWECRAHAATSVYRVLVLPAKLVRCSIPSPRPPCAAPLLVTWCCCECLVHVADFGVP